jgi:elongation factor 1-beta
MGIALIKIKIMPLSPETNLEEIKQKAKNIIEGKKGKNCNFEEELIAFGLKAIIAGFEIDESLPLEPIEDALKETENINSVEIVDMRRAFG